MNQPASEPLKHAISIDPKYDDGAIARGTLMVTEFIGAITGQGHAEAMPERGATTMEVEIPFLESAPAKLVDNFRVEVQKIFDRGAAITDGSDDTVDDIVKGMVGEHYERLAIGL